MLTVAIHVPVPQIRAQPGISPRPHPRPRSHVRPGTLAPLPAAAPHHQPPAGVVRRQEPLLQHPVAEADVLVLVLPRTLALFQVPADMFHPLVPGARPLPRAPERRRGPETRANAADARGRRLAQRDPATLPDGLQIPVGHLGAVPGRHDGRRMHASHMLRKEVLAVEIVVAPRVTGRRAAAAMGVRRRLPSMRWFRSLGHAFVQVTSVDAETQMLRADVPLPLVLGAKRRATAVPAKTAGERARV